MTPEWKAEAPLLFLFIVTTLAHTSAISQKAPHGIVVAPILTIITVDHLF
jgi:hypothetical protein